ncbi:MAG TPA: hypothetical protein VG937_10780 [Polyangiaceae bacterium]|nr:hypothetical protein [Polyangiaceae bacterium]
MPKNTFVHLDTRGFEIASDVSHIDAQLISNPMSDELATLDEPANRPNRHAEGDGDFIE